MCYDSQPNVHMSCGHTACLECLEKWYRKTMNAPSCPMCRSGMCFKGYMKLRKKWESDMRDEIYEDVMEEVMEQVECDVLDVCLMVIQERYVYTIKKWPGISRDLLNVVMRLVCVDVDVLMGVDRNRVWEPRTFEKFLFTSKRGPQCNKMLL